MNQIKYHLQIGDTASCTNRMTEITKGVCQNGIKGYTKDCFLFDSCFSSNNLEEAVMDVGTFLIGMVNTNTKESCKDTIDNLTKDCLGCSYLVLRSNPVVPGGRTIIAIGYKYNVLKVINFISYRKRRYHTGRY